MIVSNIIFVLLKKTNTAFVQEVDIGLSTVHTHQHEQVTCSAINNFVYTCPIRLHRQSNFLNKFLYFTTIINIEKLLIVVVSSKRAVRSMLNITIRFACALCSYNSNYGGRQVPQIPQKENTFAVLPAKNDSGGN